MSFEASGKISSVYNLSSLPILEYAGSSGPGMPEFRGCLYDVAAKPFFCLVQMRLIEIETKLNPNWFS